MIRSNHGRDFASAAMMRLVAAGVARRGILLPLKPSAGAYVPLLQKRDVLNSILSAHGPVELLSITDAAHDMPPEPVVHVLVNARDVNDLFDRWHRLERFSHGRHTVETVRVDEGRIHLTHCARDAGPPPSFGESLLVYGLLTTLAEVIGSVDVSLATETGEILRENGAWQAPTASSTIGSVVLSASSISNMAAHCKSTTLDDPVARLRRRLLDDPVRRWTIADLANDIGTSPRTLQRRLSQRSVSFSRLVADARLQVAASHLSDAGGPGLAEIGFLAGFSDQAHFARSFNRAVGTSPSRYRADFGR